ncbi:SDR family NAD(P)-dependent oxidoreductase [Arthrobacter sp. ATA002]|uniref:SDR family NAD(P)-dependent oxidoreductase n=1 Tax=Arthrobacter sp. ATA002 TaxID=2991715 RepID=UPI003FA426FD
MPLIAIVGAGPGLGLSLARDGIAARGYVADVTDPDALTDAVGAVENNLGLVDILEYSPAPTGAGSEALAPVAAAELTIASVAPPLDPQSSSCPAPGRRLRCTHRPGGLDWERRPGLKPRPIRRSVLGAHRGTQGAGAVLDHHPRPHGVKPMTSTHAKESRNMRTAVVTGGTGGIGFHVARRLHDEGFDVIVVGRDAGRGVQAAGAIGERARFMQADLTSLREVQKVGERIANDGPLHLLINNVGECGRPGGRRPMVSRRASRSTTYPPPCSPRAC